MNVKDTGVRIALSCNYLNGRKKSNCSIAKLLAITVSLLFPSLVAAGEYTWDISTVAGIQAGSGTWGGGSSWTTDGTTLTAWPGPGNSALFAGGDGSYTIAVAGAQTTDSIVVASSGYTLSGGTIAFGNQASVTVNIGKSVTISSLISSSYGFTKKGAGTCILSIDNPVTGSTMIQEGTLQLGIGGQSGLLDVTANIYNEGMFVFNRSDTTVISSMISGAGTLVQTGTGKTILTGYSAYAGATQILGGTLQIGDGGSGAGINGTNSILDNGMLLYNSSGNQVQSCVISGSGSLTKDGVGELTLSAANTYTGPTVVKNGMLRIDGSALSSTFTVDDSAQLGGTGTITGPVTIMQGGGISPAGTTVGKMTTGTLTFDAQSGMRFDLGTLSDTVAVNGSLTLDGMLYLTAGSGFTSGSYTLFTVTGSIIDNGVSVAVTPPGYTCSVTVNPNNVTVTMSPISVRQWIGGGGNTLWSTPGNWSGSIVPTTSDSVLFQSASSPCTLDVPVMVRSLVFESGFTQNFYLNQNKLTITNVLVFNMPGGLIAGAGDTICFDGPTLHTFQPKYNAMHPVLHQKGTGPTTVNGGSFNAQALLVTSGTFHLGNYAFDTVQTMLKVVGGSIDFGSSTLALYGNADIGNANAVVNSGGKMDFASANPQTFVPGNNKPHPAIIHSGTGTLSVVGNRLRTRKLQILAGSVVMDTALYADTVEVSNTTMFQLDTALGNSDTIHYLSGTGNLNFGKTELFIDKSLQLSTFNSLAGDAQITFFNNDSIYFMPAYNAFTIDKIRMRGSGKVLSGSFALTTANLLIYNGIWQCSVMYDSISDTLGLYGGRLDIGNGVLKIRTLESTGGTLHCNTGTLRFTGNGGRCDFGGISNLYPDSGRVEFFGGTGALFEVYPSVSTILPSLHVSVNSIDTVRIMGNLSTPLLQQNAGIVDFGDNLTHTLDTLDVTGGHIDFGNSEVSVNWGNIQLGGLLSVIDNGATLRCNGIGGTQILYPPSGVTLPAIVKTGAALLQLSSSSLSCRAFDISDGSLDFNSMNLTVEETLNVNNGTTTMLTGYDGITITVTGNANFNGQSGNLLNLHPTSTLQLNVGGSLAASYTTIGNCNATGSVSLGQAAVSCIDNGGNTNWYFQSADVTPPTGGSVVLSDNSGITRDSTPPLQLSAIDADSMRIGIAGDTATSLWKVYALQDSVDISVGGDGVKFVYVQYKDIAGNRSAWSSTSTMFDVTAPTGGSVILSDNSGVTRDSTPLLQLSATSADSMRCAIAGDTATSLWKGFTTQDSVDISAGGDGVKLVYVQYMDIAGNRSTWSSTSTMFDVTAPTGGNVVLIDNNGATSELMAQLDLSATDADSMRIAVAGDTATSLWKVYSSQDSVAISIGGIGIRYAFVQYKDIAGNQTEWYFDSTFYDTTIPAGSIAIVDNNGYTSASFLSFTVTASNADSMRVAVASDTAGAGWKGIAAIDSIMAPNNVTGSIKIYAQFKSILDKLSGWYEDSTWVDTEPPVSSIATSGNFNDYTWYDTISGTCYDASAGVDTAVIKVQRVADGMFWTGAAWQKMPYGHLLLACGSFSVPLQRTSLDDGNYSVTVQSVDKAGNRELTTVTATFSYYKKTVSYFYATPTSGFEPLDVQFTDTSLNSVTSRRWQFGDGTTDTSRAPMHRYATSGVYSVSLVIVGPGGSDTLIKDSIIAVTSLPPVAAMSQSTVAGSAPLAVSFSDSSTGKIASWQWLFGDGSSDSARSPTHTYLAAGLYTAMLVVHGDGGSDTVNSSVITVTDTTPPAAAQSVSAIALNCSTLVLSWTKTLDADVDSIAFTFDDTGYAQRFTAGGRTYTTDASSLHDTLSGFNANGQTQYITSYFIDASGNYSASGTSSSCSVVLSDCVAPEYALTVLLQPVGDSAVAVTITRNTLTEAPHTISVGTGYSKTDAMNGALNFSATDTSLLYSQVILPGVWYVATRVADVAGNSSLFHFDSITILNRAPQPTTPDSVTIDEDAPGTITLTSIDKNGDSVSYFIKKAPDGVTLGGNKLYWLPGDTDVGWHTIIYAASDSRGGVTIDSIFVEVRNTEDAPRLTFTGDTLIDEDEWWSARLNVVDPDNGDSTLLKMIYMPRWVTRRNDTLTGIPTQKDVGRDSLYCIVTDRSGLSDTMFQKITVRNSNDTPVVVKNMLPDTLKEKDSLIVTIKVYDEDSADIHTITWSPAYTWIQQVGQIYDAASSTSLFTFRMFPQQSDTGKKSVTAVIADRAGAARSISKIITIIDADDAPAPPRITRQVAVGAVNYRVRSSDDRDSVLTYTATLRLLSDTSFSLTKSGLTGNLSFYPLDDGSYQVSVVVADKNKNSTVPAYDTVIISGASRLITADTLWEMMSIPKNTATSQLANTKHLLHWDESIEEKQVYHYYLQKEEIDTMRIGKSYWRKGSGRDTISISTRGDTNRPVAIQLTSSDQGWNQVSSPYQYPVVWRGDNQTLWKWNGQKRDFEESDSILEPWQGYWVQSDTEATVLIDNVPYFNSSRLSKKKTRWFSGEKNWMFGITLISDRGMDAENRFGINPLAKKGFDAFDRLEPPRFSESASLFFPHADWKKRQTRYSADVRDKWEDVNLFEFCITGENEGEKAQLFIDGLEQGMPIYAYLTGGDTLVPVVPGDSVTISLAKELQYKTLIIVNDPSKIRMLPLAFGMGNPYPNPFCPATRIQYVLPYRWEKNGKFIDTDYHVSIDIFDMLGRKVRNLVYRTMKPGMYHLYWDGKSENGRITASGNYFIRLKADSFETTKKLIMIR